MLSSSFLPAHYNGWDRFGSLRHPQQISTGNVLPLLLQRRRSPEANQTLQDVWPSPGLVHYVYTFRGSCPWRNFVRCKIHFASKSCVLLYWQRYCTALEQRASAKLCGAVQRTRNGITELSQRSPPIFGRAAITLASALVSFSLDRHCSIDFGFISLETHFLFSSTSFLFLNFVVHLIVGIICDCSRCAAPIAGTRRYKLCLVPAIDRRSSTNVWVE